MGATDPTTAEVGWGAGDRGNTSLPATIGADAVTVGVVVGLEVGGVETTVAKVVIEGTGVGIGVGMTVAVGVGVRVGMIVGTTVGVAVGSGWMVRADVGVTVGSEEAVAV